MKYTVCIFDFDLTLADSRPGILDCFKYAMNTHEILPPDDYNI